MITRQFSLAKELIVQRVVWEGSWIKGVRRNCYQYNFLRGLVYLIIRGGLTKGPIASGLPTNTVLREQTAFYRVVTQGSLDPLYP